MKVDHGHGHGGLPAPAMRSGREGLAGLSRWPRMMHRHGADMGRLVEMSVMRRRQEKAAFQVFQHALKLDSAARCLGTDPFDDILGQHGPSWANRSTQPVIGTLFLSMPRTLIARADVESRGMSDCDNPTWVRRAIWKTFLPGNRPIVGRVLPLLKEHSMNLFTKGSS
jgi:hypothetical protein